jgi:hypothetical protein
MISGRAKKEFGVEFGPHRFRHAMGTAAPIIDPGNPAAATVLAIGSATVERYYNRAADHVAANGYHDVLAVCSATIRMALRDNQDGVFDRAW